MTLITAGFGAILTLIGGIVIGLVMWGSRVETRLTVQERAHCDLKEFLKTLIDTKFDALNSKIDQVVTFRLKE